MLKEDTEALHSLVPIVSAAESDYRACLEQRSTRQAECQARQAELHTATVVAQAKQSDYDAKLTTHNSLLPDPEAPDEQLDEELQAELLQKFAAPLATLETKKATYQRVDEAHSELLQAYNALKEAYEEEHGSPWADEPPAAEETMEALAPKVESAKLNLDDPETWVDEDADAGPLVDDATLEEALALPEDQPPTEDNLLDCFQRLEKVKAFVGPTLTTLKKYMKHIREILLLVQYEDDMLAESDPLLQVRPRTVVLERLKSRNPSCPNLCVRSGVESDDDE